MRARWLALVVGSVAVVGVSGCFRLSRNVPPIHTYTLTSPAPGVRVGPSGGLRVGLRRVELARYLAAPGVVVRRDTYRVEASEFERWGEPLDEAINRVVAARLSGRPGVQWVDVAPWAPQAVHDLLVQLQVEHFEGVASAAPAHVHMRVHWAVLRQRDGVVVVRGTSEDVHSGWTVGNVATLVRALDRSLAQLADDVGHCLASVPRDTTVLSGDCTTR